MPLGMRLLKSNQLLEKELRLVFVFSNIIKQLNARSGAGQQAPAGYPAHGVTVFAKDIKRRTGMFFALNNCQLSVPVHGCHGFLLQYQQKNGACHFGVRRLSTVNNVN